MELLVYFHCGKSSSNQLLGVQTSAAVELQLAQDCQEAQAFLLHNHFFLSLYK